MCTKQEGRYLSTKSEVHLCSETAAATASPFLLVSHQSPFLQMRQSFIFFLCDHFFPLSCLHSLTPAFFREETDKNKTFFWKKECWTCQNKKRENWKWKDVHEILRVTAAALCNSQSISVIVHKYVHACSRICMHLYIFIYLSSFARSSWKMPLCEKNRWQFFGCFPVPHLSTGMLM